MKGEMIRSLKSRFARIEDSILLSVATMVDPRFKDRFFSNTITKSIEKDALQEELRKELGASNSQVNTSTSERIFFT